MWKNNWKKYGKMVAAAVFLTAAGLCYGFAGSRKDVIRLDDFGRALEAEVDATEAAIQILDESAPETQTVGFFVHICGEVNAPGVYELPEGSRIFEAVEAAGGLTDEAEESGLNLAEKIEDGMQIVIPDKEEAESQKQAAAEASAGLVNINKASREQLMTLTGIGESRAEDIIRYREESGGFLKIEDIMKVPGIKDAAFQKIKDSITV